MIENICMRPARKSKKEKGLADSAVDLAQLMSASPARIEKSITAKGENLVGIFSDENYTEKRFKNLRQLKLDILQRAVEDIAVGVSVLRSSTFGLAISNNKINHFISPHGVLPDGNVIFSINWKDIKAFKNWRRESSHDVSQDDVNAAIYYLSAEIAKLL
jgi:hypothetical protein